MYSEQFEEFKQSRLLLCFLFNTGICFYSPCALHTLSITDTNFIEKKRNTYLFMTRGGTFTLLFEKSK